MEQNRSFVVILSVTFVLASCFGVAAWLFYPRDAVDRPSDVASFFRPAGGQPESSTEDQESPDSQVAVEQESPVDAILRDAAAIDDPLGRRLGESDQSSTQATNSAEDQDPTQINSTSRVSVTVETRTPAAIVGVGEVVPAGTSNQGSRSTQSSQNQGSTTQSGGTRPTNSTPSSSNTNTSSMASAATRQTSTAPAAPEVREEYWIQVISSPSRDRVENLQDSLLSDYGLGGRITTTLVEETTYFRLRYGPYALRDEAQKFLEWLIEVPDFQQSFISIEYN